MKKVEFIEKYGEEAWRKKRERDKRYYQANKERYIEKAAKWAKDNPDKDRESHIKSIKKWRSNNKERIKNYEKQYREINKKAIAERSAKYKREHKEEIATQKKKWEIENKILRQEKRIAYNKTKKGRAIYIANRYSQGDKKRGFDISKNIDGKWIIENIFSGQKCIYCGDQDWTHLGCDRIDNSKPHTPENIVCACFVCNLTRGGNYTVEEFKKYRSLHPRACDIQKEPLELLNENGALKKRPI